MKSFIQSLQSSLNTKDSNDDNKFEHIVLDNALFCAINCIKESFQGFSQYYDDYTNVQTTKKAKGDYSYSTLFDMASKVIPQSTIGEVKKNTTIKDAIKLSGMSPLKIQLQRLRRRIQELTKAMSEVLYSDKLLQSLTINLMKDVHAHNNINNNLGFRQSVRPGASRARPSLQPIHENTNNIGKDDDDAPRDSLSTSIHPALLRRQRPESSRITCDDETVTMNVQNVEIMFDKWIVELQWISADIDDLMDQIHNSEGIVQYCNDLNEFHYFYFYFSECNNAFRYYKKSFNAIYRLFNNAFCIN